MPVPGLEPLDGKLLDGLQFCAIAYDLFESIRAESSGLEELRLLRTPRAKKMIEEILPIASYVQNRYGVEFRISVRWRGGNQKHDAVIHCTGQAVQRLAVPARQHLEVTTAVHPKDYLVREHLHREGFAFAPEGTHRDPVSKQTVSTPVVRSGGDIERDLANWIGKRIQAKTAIKYPPNTSLLVRCVVNTPVLDDEWNDAVRILRQDNCPHWFREVVLLEPISNRVTTLYVRQGRKVSRSNKRLHLSAAAVTFGRIAKAARGRRK